MLYEKEVVKKNIKKWKKANSKRAIEHLKFVTQMHRHTQIHTQTHILDRYRAHMQTNKQKIGGELHTGLRNSYSIRRPLYCATYVSISIYIYINVLYVCVSICDWVCCHPSYILLQYKNFANKTFRKKVRFVDSLFCRRSLLFLARSFRLFESVGRTTEWDTHTISTVRYVWLLRSPVTTLLLCIRCACPNVTGERAAQKRNAEGIKKSNPLSYRMLHSFRLVLSCESTCVCCVYMFVW